MTSKVADKIAKDVVDFYTATEVKLENAGYEWGTRNVVRMSALHSLIKVENGHVIYMVRRDEHVEADVEIENVEDGSGTA